MKIKFLAVAFMLTFFAAVGFAGDSVRLALNFWDSDADIVPIGKLPPGVKMLKKAPFLNKKIYGFTTQLIIDITQAPKVELKFTIKGKPGKIVPSLTVCRGKDGKTPTVECTNFEFNDEPSPKTPLKFSGWTNLGLKTEVNDGDTITLTVEFDPATK